MDIKEFRAKLLDGSDIVAPIVRFTSSTDPVIATDARVATFVFSDNSVDRYGDTIDARGWVLDKYMSNPVALFGHDAGSVENVIGKAKNVRVEGQRLIGDIEFMEASINPNAEAVYQMVKGGYLNAVSVGFSPLEWSLAKDKTRPQGVDFKKQELLEISIVPIPANPTALVQARAAGIDVDRLRLLTADASPVSKKGLYEVSWLAGILAELGFLADCVEWETEYEGDGSAVPAKLTDALKMLGQTLIDMAAEEVAELLSEEKGMAGVDLSALSPAQRAFVILANQSSAAKKLTVNLDASDLREIVIRSGKVLSAANEKCLRDAHAAIMGGCDQIKGLFDKPTDDQEPDDDETKAAEARAAEEIAAKAAAKRARRAKAMKLRIEASAAN